MAGFLGRRREHDDRVPPGQYVTHDFPVLTAGPTEVVPTDRWELTVSDGDDQRDLRLGRLCTTWACRPSPPTSTA